MNLAPALALLLGLASLAPCRAQTEFGGEIRPSVVVQRNADRGPLASAAMLLPGVSLPPTDIQELQAELHARLYGFSGTASVITTRTSNASTRVATGFNELYWSGGAGPLQLTVGRRIVSWDVGSGFRPNDVVQQEARRLLVPTTPVGRDVVMVERYDATTAWSLVLVNPGESRDRRGPREPALAARYYRQEGAVDWHVIARYGARTRGSIGAAAAWVVSDSTELHGSLRYLQSADSIAMDPGDPVVASGNPWRPAIVRGAAQALVGGTWTSARQLSVLAEAWWDGVALSDDQWAAWNSRNRQLGSLVNSAVPASALGANLAWQADAFSVSSNLRRLNVYARAGWKYRSLEPAVDLLHTPSDGGSIWTASLGWQGESVRVEGGARFFEGRRDAVIAQTPIRRIFYAYGSWRF